MKSFIFNVFILFSASLSAQGNLENRGVINIEGGSEIFVKGNFIIDSPVTGDGYLTYTGSGNNTIEGTQVQINKFKTDASGILKMKDAVYINSFILFVTGKIDLLDQSLFINNSNGFGGGNDSAYIISGGAGKVVFPSDSINTLLPIGLSGIYTPLSVQQFGTADTFELRIWPNITNDGTNTGSPLTSHVGLFGIEINEMIAQQNEINLTVQFNDNSLGIPFDQTNSGLITFANGNYIPLSNCGTDISNINPNIMSINSLQEIGLFGVGDSLYLPEIPVANTTPNGIINICLGDSLLVSANQGAAYLWNTGDTSSSIYISSAGNYNVYVTNSFGCTATSASLQVNINLPDSTFLNEENCLSYIWPTNGIEYFSSGTYTAQLNNISGCDSVVQLQLIINTTDSIYETIIACSDYTWPANGNNYTSSGSFTFTLYNQQGCDSVMSLDLQIIPAVFQSQQVSICNGNTFQVGTNTYSNSGTYIDTLTSASGCDSIVTTILNVISCSGIISIENHTFNMYPNPTSDVLYFEYTLDDFKIMVVDIFELTGKKIVAYEINQNPAIIDVSNLSAGTYIAKVNGKAYRWIKK
jgi:hypothetical protein